MVPHTKQGMCTSLGGGLGKLPGPPRCFRPRTIVAVRGPQLRGPSISSGPERKFWDVEVIVDHATFLEGSSPR
jgi:hypothetical protein